MLLTVLNHELKKVLLKNWNQMLVLPIKEYTYISHTAVDLKQMMMIDKLHDKIIRGKHCNNFIQTNNKIFGKENKFEG